MNLYRNCFIMTVMCLFVHVSSAMEIPKHFPKDLIYKNQPIDPLCFESDHTDTNAEPILLTSCGLQEDAAFKATGKNEKLIKEGFVGFDYTWTDEKDPKLQSHGYSYYKAYKTADHSFLIYLVNSGGGSGQFSSITLAKREGDKLKLKQLMAGDRCNNGIEEVKQSDKGLQIKVNLTPFDYIEIAKQNPHQLKAYDDLASCAACCAGAAIYEQDLKQSHTPVKFVSINLGEGLAEGNTQGKYQVCFNKLVEEYKKNGKQVMNPDQLTEFANQFNKQCVSST